MFRNDIEKFINRLGEDELFQKEFEKRLSFGDSKEDLDDGFDDFDFDSSDSIRKAIDKL